MNPITWLLRLFSWIWRLWREIHEEALGPALEPALAVPSGVAQGGRKRRPAQAAALSTIPREISWKPIVIMATVALSLTMQHYWGDRGEYATLFDRGWFPFVDREYWELWSYVWWTGWRVLGYLALPIIVVLALPGERLRDYGFSFKGFFKHLPIYVVLFAVFVPVIWYLSGTKTFRGIYPFYRIAHRSTFDLVAWELLYALQFLSLEFFFRGFMLHGLKKHIGVHAIWVMTVPYCMIHYGKAMSESLAAVFAGLILGTLALRTRSIWGGVLIHVGVAITMDLLCLRHCPPGLPCPR